MKIRDKLQMIYCANYAGDEWPFPQPGGKSMANTRRAEAPGRRGKMEQTLVFKWGASRRRDTYGYTICSLYVDGRKVSSCNGGGYDMKGTCLGDYIAGRFAKELREINKDYSGLSFHDPNYDPGKYKPEPGGKTVEELEAEGKSLGLDRYQAFYRASSKLPTERHTVPLIDGACGMSSVERIVNAIGYQLTYITGGRRSKDDIYILKNE